MSLTPNRDRDGELQYPQQALGGGEARGLRHDRRESRIYVLMPISSPNFLPLLAKGNYKMSANAIGEMLKRELDLSEKRRGMFGSTHFMEVFFLATLYAQECLTTDSLSVKNVHDSWIQARQAIHGEQFGVLVLADLPGTDPQLVAKELSETRPAAKCVRRSFKSRWSCIRSRTVGGSMNIEGVSSPTTNLLSQLVERFLDSDEYLLAPDQEESFLGNLMEKWSQTIVSTDIKNILNECVEIQRKLIGSTATGIAWRCEDMHGCAHRRRYTAEEAITADQQVLDWVRKCATSNRFI